MGSSKADLPIGDVTYLERIVSVLLAMFDMVYVCGGDRTVLGSTLIHDPVRHGGPLGGMVSALRSSSGAAVFMTTVDMPLLQRSTISALCDPPVGRGHARIARVEGRPQPLCGMYSGDLADLADRHLRSTDRSVMGFVRDVPHLELVDITDGSLRNINTPRDHEALAVDLR